MTTPFERPRLAIIDGDILVYRVGFASDDVDEAICLGRVTALVNEIVYQNLQCDDYKAYITGRGKEIAGNGVSEGVVPWAKIYDSTILATNQGSVRRGAASVNLHINHRVQYV